MSHQVVKWCDGETKTWSPTTLDDLSKQEEFLEEIIAENPHLLGLETRRTGIRGPFIPFRQLTFRSPQGRVVRPDIVFLTASGQVIIVEVKRNINPELKDRSVIAQSVDYAASFSAMSEEEITSLFKKDDNSSVSWPELIQDLFDEEDYEDLAQTLMSRFKNGSLYIVIACDKAPAGLDELVKGVASQSALEFDLSVVEVTPYVQKGFGRQEIIFIPKTRLETEVVSRTVVTVTYKQEDVKPSVTVQTTSINEIEDNLISKVRKTKRQWDKISFFEDLNDRTDGSEIGVANKILKWAEEHSLEVKWGSGAVNGTFYIVLKCGEERCDLFGAISSGKVEIVFQYHPLKTEEQKIELHKRINALRDVTLPDKAVKSWANFPMAALESEDNFEKFVKIWEWAINIIKAEELR